MNAISVVGKKLIKDLKRNTTKGNMTDYLWLDCEMTGLDKKNCRIIEVAAFLTKDDLVPYTDFEAVVYQNSEVGWEQVAKEMHQKSGLFEKVQKEGSDERDVVRTFTEWLKTHLDRRLVNMAGNTVHFDRQFMIDQWPAVKPFLTHRILDVSSFKIYAEGQGIKKFADQPAAHRAMDDIKHSLKEFQYYLAELKKMP